MVFANTLLRVEIPDLGSSLGQNPVLGASVDDANRLTPLWKLTSTARPFCSILGNSTKKLMTLHARECLAIMGANV